ncbi:hypothetical protein [Mycobacterium sp. JS623]|uniref:hypothetical protein n=1 Tax=Mycobacterium sp. JS623 TaxID=212767 RepID=UPI0002F8F14B|nr:hypothetical protein [Mycobacterium sp. JS623]
MSPIRGEIWHVCSKAAAAVIEYAFGPLGLDRIEAWVESTNLRSLATARRVGLTEHGQLAQRYPHRETPHESIVLGRSRDPETTAVLNVEATLPVLDVAAELDVLRAVLGARVLYEVGDPPAMVGVVFGPWSVGPGLRLVVARSPIAPITVTVDVGTEFDSAHRRAAASGADIASAPVEQPWGMREFVLRLSDGHQLVVTGPS